MKKKLTCFVIALAMTVAIPTVASAAAFGGGCSYTKSLSYTYASTTTTLAGGYSGTAEVIGTAYFCTPSDPDKMDHVHFCDYDSADAGGVTASCSISHDGYYTVGRKADAIHEGRAAFVGGMPAYTYYDDSYIEW